MDKLLITGGAPLHGTIRIGGAKNAALPLMAASLLSEEPLVLGNVPSLTDITTLAEVLEGLGVAASFAEPEDHAPGHGRTLMLHAQKILSDTAPYDLVRTMRASILVLGPLLARHGSARVSLPGGCAIGPRPVDLHLAALEEMGARVELDQGYITATAPQGLHGTTIRFRQVSVGATENTLMAATLAKGTTVLENAAREPEITDLAECLIRMGAKIEGLGSSTLTVHGVEALHGAQHDVIPDRIETGSFLIAAAMTGGELVLTHTRKDFVQALCDKLEAAGVAVLEMPGGLVARRKGDSLYGIAVHTAPYPHFPTDLQAQLMALACIARGESALTETIFENRLMHVPELQRMGANIYVQGNTAHVTGVERLKGAPVMATDLRASVCLVLAALIAEGQTTIDRIYHLDRGYDRIEDKLRAVGAVIERSGE